jgi:tetratricopeptide (TPR) repeat protein
MAVKIAFIRTMAKKKKKKSRGSKVLCPKSLEQQAQNHLSTGRFRQAVDDYKALIKQDPDAYLPGLRAAYEGLYKQRLDKGMLAEAGMVLDQLGKLPGDAHCVESIRLWLKSREFAKAAGVAIKVLAGDVQIPPQESALVADALVMAFEESPPPQDLPDSVGDHLQRIQTALAAVAGQKYQRALSAIRVIGLQSIFFSWKCLVKGYCAFYSQEDAKALAAFKMIAAGSVPEAAAAPYVGLLAHTAGSGDVARDPGLLASMCAVAGYPEIAPDLARAEYLWQVGRFRDSLNHMLGALDHFPTLSPGLAYTLTELYYNACFQLPSEPALKYFRQLARSAGAKGNGNALAQFWASRSAALYLEQQDFDDQILAQWEHFLELDASPYAGSPKVRALVYGRLGDLFSEEIPDNNPFSFFFSRRRRNTITLRNAELARYCYEKSLGADPDSRDTRLSLIGFFEKTNDRAGVNRQLDQVIKQFPGEKDVLFKAGVRCMNRKALVKAMNYLDQALALDPTDRAVREMYSVACIRAAHNYARKDRADKFRALLPGVIAVSDANSDHFNLGRAYLYARWAAFEQLTGNDAEADRIWRQALAHKPAGEFKVHIFYWIVAQYYDVPERHPQRILAAVRKHLKGAVDPITAAALADTLLYAQELPESVSGLYAETDRFEQYMLRAAGMEMTRDQAKTILAYALSDECDYPEIAERCVDNMLQRHPEDAFFRYHRFLLQDPSVGCLQDLPEQIRELETILQLAREQKEARVAVAVQKMRNELEAVKHHEIIDDPEMDVPYDLDAEPDEQELEAMMDLFDGLKRPSRKNKKKPKKENKPKGPEQLELF